MNYHMVDDSDDDFDLIEETKKKNEEIKEKQENNQWKYCKNCNVESIEDTGQLFICPKCGVEIQNINDMSLNFNIESMYNTSGDSVISTKLEGKNSYRLNRTLQKACANNNRYNNDKKTVKKLNKLYYNSNYTQIPVFTNELTVKDYNDVKQISTLRGKSQNSMLAVLSKNAHQENGNPMTSKEIAKIFNVKLRDLSKASAKLQSYKDLGVLTKDFNNSSYEPYIKKYMNNLDIDMKWIPFVLDIITKADEKHIYIKKSPKLTTKCVGAIYLLITSIPELKKNITNDDISKKCDISIATFIDNRNVLFEKIKKLKSIYKKHRIELPDA